MLALILALAQAAPACVTAPSVLPITPVPKVVPMIAPAKDLGLEPVEVYTSATISADGSIIEVRIVKTSTNSQIDHQAIAETKKLKFAAIPNLCSGSAGVALLRFYIQ